MSLTNFQIALKWSPERSAPSSRARQTQVLSVEERQAGILRCKLAFQGNFVVKMQRFSNNKGDEKVPEAWGGFTIWPYSRLSNSRSGIAVDVANG